MKRWILLICVWAYSWHFSSAQLPGDLIITEFMAHSLGVSDEQGEYVEFYNTTFYPVNLNGCVIQDFSGVSVSVTEDVWVQPGQFALTGRSAVPFADYYFPSSPPPFNLNNMGGDGISLTCNGTLIASLTYASNQVQGVARELLSTDLHVDGTTQESHYGPAAFPFKYIGASVNDKGSPGYGGNTIVLPVTYTYFELEPAGDKVLLRWGTASEVNNSHFVVEHRGGDQGAPFRPAAEIPGGGNSQHAREYSFLHESPVAGLNYYRLRQVDYDGTFEYSDLRVLALPAAGTGLQLFPNAARHRLTVQLPENKDGVRLFAFNLQGQRQASYTLPPGATQAVIDLYSLAPGTYYLQGQAGGRLLISRFFKL